MVVITTPLTTAGTVNDVYIAEDRYALLATASGIEIVDLFKGKVISSGTLGGTPTAVVAEFTTPSGNLYVGTTSSGIYAARWKALREPGLDFTESLVQRFSTSTTPAVSANQINDLAVLPGRLLISTGSGIDFITLEGLLATRLLDFGSQSCQITSAGEAYWSVTNSGVEANYDLFPASGTGIITVDFEYNATSSIPLLSNSGVNDLALVAGSPNLLGIATDGGALIIEEQQFSEATSQTVTLFPLSEAVVSVDFSKEATFDSGTVYLGNPGAIRVFGLADTAISGSHFTDANFNSARDQSIVSGTVTVVRTTNVA